MNSRFPGWASAMVATASLAAGVFLALAHPVLPQFVALPVFLGVVLLSVWRPWLGLLALPALAPILNFAPWTGRLVFDEFDLLVLAVLAVLAGGYWGSKLRDAKALAWPAITRPFFCAFATHRCWS